MKILKKVMIAGLAITLTSLSFNSSNKFLSVNYNTAYAASSEVLDLDTKILGEEGIRNYLDFLIYETNDLLAYDLFIEYAESEKREEKINQINLYLEKLDSNIEKINDEKTYSKSLLIDSIKTIKEIELLTGEYLDYLLEMDDFKYEKLIEDLKRFNEELENIEIKDDLNLQIVSYDKLIENISEKISLLDPEQIEEKEVYEDILSAFSNLESEEMANLLSLLDQLKDYKNHINYKYLDDKQKQALEDSIKKANDLLISSSAQSADIKEGLKDLREKSFKLLKDPISLRKEVLQTKITQVEDLLTEENKKKIGKENFEQVKNNLLEIKNKKDVEDVKELDSLIEKTDKEKVTILGLLENTKDLTKFNELVEKVDSSTNIKETQTYYRSTKSKKDDFDKALKEASDYLEEIEDDNSKIDDEKINQLIKNLDDKKDLLDGYEYDSLLSELLEKIKENEKNLDKKVYEELIEDYNSLVDDSKHSKTIDDIKELSNKVDENIKKSKVNDKKLVSVRKLSGKVVRTGIDSVKIFALVAIIAGVILILTRKKNK